MDANKGREESPDIRCTLVARDFRLQGEKGLSDIFAAMPPLYANDVSSWKVAAREKLWKDGW